MPRHPLEARGGERDRVAILSERSSKYCKDNTKSEKVRNSKYYYNQINNYH